MIGVYRRQRCLPESARVFLYFVFSMEIKFFYLPPFRASPVCLKGRAIRLVVKFYFRISGFMFSSYGGEGGGGD